MAELDIVDEALIDADPASVYAAIAQLSRGRSQWWPGVEIKPHGEIPADLVGGVFDEARRRLPGPNSTLRIVEARENEMIRNEYIDGPFFGTGTFTLSPVDGKTRVSYRWVIRPRALPMRMLIFAVPRVHRRFMRVFFDGLRRYVEPEARDRPSREL
jgi:uncharacterized protein YndB with AHSA1/START domain